MIGSVQVEAGEDDVAAGDAAVATARYALTLPPGALRYVNLRAAAEAVTVAVAVGALIALLAPAAWRPALLILLAVLVAVALTVDLPLVNRLAVRSTSYECDGTTLRIRRGILFSRDIAVPCAQILDVVIAEVPLLRSCGLVGVRCRTIMGGERLGPVTPAEADRIRSVILGRRAAG